MKTSPLPTQDQLGFLSAVSTVQIVEELGRRLGGAGWMDEGIEVFNALERNIGAITQAGMSGARVRAKQQASGQVSGMRKWIAKAIEEFKGSIKAKRTIDTATRDSLMADVDREFLIPDDPTSLPLDNRSAAERAVDDLNRGPDKE